MCEVDKKRVAPIVQQQKNILVDFMQNHEQLLSGRFTATFTKQTAQKLWQEVTVILNAVPGGSKKQWMQWRKTWQDIKKNIKAKAVTEKKYTQGTGGGPKILTKFDDTETKVLSLISPKSVFGDDSVAVPTIIFDYNEVPSTKSDLNGEVQFEVVGDNAKEYTENIDFQNLPNSDMDSQNSHENILGDVQVSRNQKTPIPENVSETVQVPGNVSQETPTVRRRRSTKIKRLETSLGISNNLLKIEEEKKTSVIKFYEAKMKYMAWRQTYETEKLQALKESNSLKHEILRELKEIKVALNK